MKLFLLFALLVSCVAFIAASSFPSDDIDQRYHRLTRIRRGGCDFYGCQRFCHNLGDGTGPKGGGVCVKNHCDCSIVPKNRK